MTAPTKLQPAAVPVAMTRADVLAICRRHEAYGRSPTRGLQGDDAIVAAIRDVLLAMQSARETPLALADALDRTLLPMPKLVTREARLIAQHVSPGTKGAPSAPGSGASPREQGVSTQPPERRRALDSTTSTTTPPAPLPPVLPG